jgi:hypothetical protein
MSMIEGSQGSSFFFIPKQFRGKFDRTMYASDRFDHLKGSNDFLTYINIFKDMFEYARNARSRCHIDKCLGNYAQDNSFNNKLLKKVRKHFIKMTNLIYGGSYKDNDFMKCIYDYNSSDISFGASDMLSVYKLFADVYSDRVFCDPETSRGLTFRLSGKLERYCIDNMRSFSYISQDNQNIIALQVVQNSCGGRTTRFMSCIFPVPDEMI